MKRRVADTIAASLLAHGTDRAFGVPGESFLALLDALVDVPAIDLVTCRHEGSAALADAKLTGRPGIVMVSRGPGLANAMIGIHVASQDAVPLIVLVGQVDTPNLGRGAVQEIDAKEIAALLKWSARIDHPGKVSEVIARAYAAASNGTPGPVIVELPEDILLLESVEQIGPLTHGVAIARAADSDIDQTVALLANARRPLLIIGGQCRWGDVRQHLLSVSEAWSLPVLVTSKNQDLYPNDHGHWAGSLGFFGAPQHEQLIDDADLVLAVGTRLGDITTLGWSVLKGGQQRLVHVYVDPAQINRHFAPDLAVVADAGDFLQKLSKRSGARRTDREWLFRAAQVRQQTDGWQASRVPAEDILGRTISAAASLFGPHDLVTADSGNFAGWVHRAFRFGAGNRYISTSCGAMGMGVPAAVAAALRHPERTVFCFCGDGGFLMNGNDFITACTLGLNVKVFVSNNRSYGTIRSHQQRAFPDRPSGTDLHNPSFDAIAEAFGARGYRVEKASDIAGVVSDAVTRKGPALVDIRCDVDYTLQMSIAAQN